MHKICVKKTEWAELFVLVATWKLRRKTVYIYKIHPVYRFIDEFIFLWMFEYLFFIFCSDFADADLDLVTDARGSIPISYRIPNWKKTTLRRIVVWETCVSRHHVAYLRTPLKPLEHHDVMVSKGLREALNWPHIMPIVNSLSDNRCIFYRSGPGWISVSYRIEPIVYRIQFFLLLYFGKNLELYMVNKIMKNKARYDNNNTFLFRTLDT